MNSNTFLKCHQILIKQLMTGPNAKQNFVSMKSTVFINLSVERKPNSLFHLGSLFCKCFVITVQLKKILWFLSFIH